MTGNDAKEQVRVRCETNADLIHHRPAPGEPRRDPTTPYARVMVS